MAASAPGLFKVRQLHRRHLSFGRGGWLSAPDPLQTQSQRI